MWVDLLTFVDSVEGRRSIIQEACDRLIQSNRLFDAACLFAASPNEPLCPDSIVAKSTNEESLRIVLQALLGYADMQQREKYASAFRLRVIDPTLGGWILRSNGGHQAFSMEWFSRLVDDPFSTPGREFVPESIRALSLLTTSNLDDAWFDRLLETQRAVTRPSSARSRVAFANDENNSFAHAVRARVDRLGFQLMCAETLLGKRSSMSARIANEMRNSTLLQIISRPFSSFSFPIDNVKSLIGDIASSGFATASERLELNALQIVEWLAQLCTCEDIGRLDEAVLFETLTQHERAWAVVAACRLCVPTRVERFSLEDGLDLLCRFLARITHRYLADDENVTSTMRDVELYLNAAREVVGGRDLNIVLNNPQMVAVACLEAGKWDLARDLAIKIGMDDLVRDADLGKAMDDNEVRDLDETLFPRNNRVISLARADLVVRQCADGVPFPRLVLGIEVTDPVQIRIDAVSNTQSRIDETRRMASPITLQEEQNRGSSSHSYVDGFNSYLDSCCGESDRSMILHDGLISTLVHRILAAKRRKDRTLVFDSCAQYGIDPVAALLRDGKGAHDDEFVSALRDAEGYSPIRGLNSQSKDVRLVPRLLYRGTADVDEDFRVLHDLLLDVVGTNHMIDEPVSLRCVEGDNSTTEWIDVAPHLLVRDGQPQDEQDTFLHAARSLGLVKRDDQEYVLHDDDDVILDPYAAVRILEECSLPSAHDEVQAMIRTLAASNDRIAHDAADVLKAEFL